VPRVCLASDDRTSHKPRLIGRHSGKPIGYPNCTLARSRPIFRWSSRGNSFNHSRTGSRPVADLQNTSGMAFSFSVIHKISVSKKILICKHRESSHKLACSKEKRHFKLLQSPVRACYAITFPLLSCSKISRTSHSVRHRAFDTYPKRPTSQITYRIFISPAVGSSTRNASLRCSLPYFSSPQTIAAHLLWLWSLRLYRRYGYFIARKGQTAWYASVVERPINADQLRHVPSASIAALIAKSL
jgi:hypothetical protein